jgi:hypothetical protein
MATPINYNQQFQKDNQQLLADAKQLQDSITEANNAHTQYLKNLKNLNVSATYALILLFYIMGASSNDDTSLGDFTNKAGITGERLKVNSDLTAVGNDLNNMTNSNSKDPALVTTFGQDSDILLDELSGDPSRTHYNSDLDPNAANPSIDPQAEQSVYNQLAQIRKQFNIDDPGESYNYNPGPNDTYYFSGFPNEGSKIQSFYEFQQDLGQQGDVKGATDVAKIITDNFSTNTQTTQTSSAVLNNDQKTYTAMMQAIQSFLAATAQWWNGIVKGANSHMASGT